MIDIILIGVENSGNIGAVARCMKNFGFKNLFLVEPEAKITEESRKRAKHANDILDKTKIIKKTELKKYDYLIGTTSKLGNDYNIPRCPLNPEQLSEKIINIKNKKIGIVFGREGKGLYNHEIEMCDFLVTIETDKKYPALNLSHSVSIILYELSKGNDKKIGQGINPISKNEKKILLDMIKIKLNKMKFSTPEKKNTQITVWKKVIGKALLTKREAFALMGFFRKF